MATVLKAFITKLRFESDRSGLIKAEKALNNFKNSALRIGASIFAVVGGGKLLGDISKSISEMGRFADSVGVSVTELQEFEFVARRVGSSTSDLRALVSSLTGILGKSARGVSTYTQILARFGVQVFDTNGMLLSTFDVLKNINKVFQGLSRAQQFDLAKNLGIGKSSIRLFQLAPKELEKLLIRAKQLGLVTKSNAQQAIKFQASLVDLRQSFFFLGQEIFGFLSPALIKINASISDLLTKLPELIPIIKAIGLVIGIALIPAMAKLSFSFIRMGATAASAWALAGGPIFLIALAISALILTVRELWVGLHGGRSILLDFIKNSKTIQAIWSGIEEVFIKVRNAIRALENTRAFKLLFPEKSLETVQKTRDRGNVTSSFRKDSPLNSNPFLGKTLSALSNPLTRQNQPVSQSSNRSLSVDVGGITVNTTSDNPQKIASVITDQLNNQLKDSVNFFDGDIAR